MICSSLLRVSLFLLAMASPAQAPAQTLDPERFSFFQKVGVFKQAAKVCDDRDLDRAVVHVLNSPEVQTVKGDDTTAAAGVVTGVVMFNRRVAEQGLGFNCALVKELARRDGLL
jgi:hypothetical protein